MKLSKQEIKDIRAQTGLTQEQFCRVYKIPYGTLTSWEQGMRNPHETGTIYLLAIKEDHEGMARIIGKIP